MGLEAVSSSQQWPIQDVKASGHKVEICSLAPLVSLNQHGWKNMSKCSSSSGRI